VSKPSGLHEETGGRLVRRTLALVCSALVSDHARRPMIVACGSEFLSSQNVDGADRGTTPSRVGSWTES